MSPLPSVISLNCLEDCSFEQETLTGIATFEHVSLSNLTNGRIESSSAVLLHSLSFLPRAAQRRLHHSQLILCLGSPDRSADSALADELGLRLVHVDACRDEEVADTVMGLLLGLIRRTHVLSRYGFSASGWFGSVQPLCRGMRRCRGLVLGIVGRSGSARALAIRSLAFRMSVLYFDVNEEKGKSSRPSVVFPPSARRMDTLNDLFATSDLVSLHCDLSDETLQIITAECLQHIKPGSFLVNTGSSQLIDDCALKQLLIDGTLAGCALDGAEGPQWMEAWVREMPNVLMLPHSADYSEEVWMEIREKSTSILRSFFLDGIIPGNAISDEVEVANEFDVEDEQSEKLCLGGDLQVCTGDQLTDDIQLNLEIGGDKDVLEPEDLVSQQQSITEVNSAKSEERRSKSSRKGKKRHANRRSPRNSNDQSGLDRDSNCASQQENDTALTGTNQVLSSSPHCASPVDSISNKNHVQSTIESTSKPHMGAIIRLGELVKDGSVIALQARDQPAYFVSRQRVPGGGWFLDIVPNVTKRDPATQFLVVLRNKDTFGLRSFSAGGKLLQINRKMEFVFASHSFDVWESWMLEGSSLKECRLVNCRNPSSILDVRIELLAAVSEDDGIARWLE